MTRGDAQSRIDKVISRKRFKSESVESSNHALNV